MSYIRKIYFAADEGYQAIILDLIGKNNITHSDFNKLVKGLLLNAHNKSDGCPVLINRKFCLVTTDPFYKCY